MKNRWMHKESNLASTLSGLLSRIWKWVLMMLAEKWSPAQEEKKKKKKKEKERARKSSSCRVFPSMICEWNVILTLSKYQIDKTIKLLHVHVDYISFITFKIMKSMFPKQISTLTTWFGLYTKPVWRNATQTKWREQKEGGKNFRAQPRVQRRSFKGRKNGHYTKIEIGKRKTCS